VAIAEAKLATLPPTIGLTDNKNSDESEHALSALLKTVIAIKAAIIDNKYCR